MTSFVLGAACAEITSYSAQTGATNLVAGQPFVVPNKPGLYKQCDEWHKDDTIALIAGQSASAVSPPSAKIGGMCNGATVTITGGVGAGGVTTENLSTGAKIIINGDVAGDLVLGSMSSDASITVTGAVRGVIRAPDSMSSGAKIEAGSCPGGIVRPKWISSRAQIICRGQVRYTCQTAEPCMAAA